MLLIIGFNGVMAHRFSGNVQEINGARIVDYNKISKYINKENKICIIGTVKSDDAFLMPDDKTKKVISGELQLSLLWHDGTQKILIDRHKQSQLIKFVPEKSGTEIFIHPQNIETVTDTLITADKLRTSIFGNFMKIEYYDYRFRISGLITQGKPQIKYIRKTLDNNQKAAVILSKAGIRNSKKDLSFDVLEVIPYETAVKRELSSGKSLRIYIAMLVLGVIMFFIPENTRRF
ncbi:MAG: hypothetical protein VZQ51_06090 [Bacteroidales bacterium]|nr:hypothetical protein [Bacteroidales bacterium]